MHSEKCNQNPCRESMMTFRFSKVGKQSSADIQLWCLIGTWLFDDDYKIFTLSDYFVLIFGICFADRQWLAWHKTR